MLAIGLQGKCGEQLDLSGTESDNKARGDKAKGDMARGDAESKCISEFEFSNELKIY